MSLPKEPRQLMINLMYLVLTAMLALNVSSEILHAFKTINNSVMKSTSLIEGKNQDTYMSLQANQDIKENTARVKPYNDRAKLVKEQSESFIAYLETWKTRIINEAGGKEKDDTAEIKRPDDIDASTRLLVEGPGGNEIKKKIEDLRNFLISQMDEEARSSMAKELPLSVVKTDATDNNPQGDWATGNFYNMPVMAAVTLFSKIQNDVRSSESIVIDHLFQKSKARPFEFDAIKAIAVPRNSYALQGQKITADILLGAYNSTVNPSVSSSSGRVVSVKEGVATWETNAAGVGMQTVRGSVTINMNGQAKTEPWEFSYVVGSAGASLQLDNMNVFYVGVPNPITVTAAGYSLEDVSMSIPGADLTPTGLGKYNVMVPTSLIGKMVEASINAKDATGAKNVGKMMVRVKRIPDPQARVANKAGGGMPASSFRVQDGVIAVLEGFEFPAKFRVTGFSFSAAPKRGEYIGPFAVSGPQFRSSKDVEASMSRLKPGDKVFIEEIRGVGPDNITRRLNDIIFTLN